MKRRGLTGIISMIVTIIWASTVWCAEPRDSDHASSSTASDTEARESEGMMSSMKGDKMKMHQMMGDMIDKRLEKRMDGIMAEMLQKKMSEKDGRLMHGGKRGIGEHALMEPFHRWMGCLMSRWEVLDLSPEQKGAMDDALTRHLMAAIRFRAEARALGISLKHALRKDPLDLQSIENLVRKLTDQEFALLMEGIRLYEEVLGILTSAQREKIEEIIGSPFPPPWKDMTPGPRFKDPGTGSPIPDAKMKKPEKGGSQAHRQ
ncbi:MAG: periplasmic heavy metal sensor [Deltaproteobacteria bacterium]|nr:periplasmic heavy metal sensor [Deltaproteobacteria bacterium]